MSEKRTPLRIATEVVAEARLMGASPPDQPILVLAREVLRLRDENVRMGASLHMLDGWDMISPPVPREQLADAGWVRRVVDDGLGRPVPSTT